MPCHVCSKYILILNKISEKFVLKGAYKIMIFKKSKIINFSLNKFNIFDIIKNINIFLIE